MQTSNSFSAPPHTSSSLLLLERRNSTDSSKATTATITMSSFAEQILDIIWFNSPRTTKLQGDGEGYPGLDLVIQSMSDENWEQLGSAIANNTHLKT